MNNKYDILEKCLQALEEGHSIDSILARYPDQARELRPLLETAIQSRILGGAPVPSQFQKRGRNRLIRRAAELRESKPTLRRRTIPFFPRLAITFGVVGALALSSTGLVSASSGALPGDQLYPVKRTWEDARLLFIFSSQQRDILESQFEQERLDEIDELLTKGRAVPITFSGLVSQQQDGQWLVSSIPVTITNSTRLSETAIALGSPITVVGITSNNGVVEAQDVQLLQPGVSLPPLVPSEKGDQSGDHEDSNSAPTSKPIVTQKPIVVITPGTPMPQSQPSSYEFSGVVESMQDSIWTINGQSVHVDQAQVNGDVQLGSAVKFQGYYDANGEFIVSNLQVTSGGDSATPHRNDNGNGSGSPTQVQGSGGDKSGSGGGGTSGGGDGGGSGGGTPSGGSGDSSIDH